MSSTKQRTENNQSVESTKALGAFYTDAQIADFLIWWAIRSDQDKVMDPSFGAGIFLESACKRLILLGGKPANQVYGVEIDPTVHPEVVKSISEKYGVKK